MLEGEWSREESAEGETYYGTVIFSKYLAPYSVQISNDNGTFNQKVEIQGSTLVTTNYSGEVRSTLTLHGNGSELTLRGTYEYHSGQGELTLTNKKPPEPHVPITDLDIFKNARFEGKWTLLKSDNSVRRSGKLTLSFDGNGPKFTIYRSNGRIARSWFPRIILSGGELKIIGNRVYTFRLFKKDGKMILKGWSVQRGELKNSAELFSYPTPVPG